MASDAAISSTRTPRDLRGVILRVATELFAERGFAATSMRDIGERAACTKAALYYYFKSKQALFLEIIRAENETVTALLEAELRPGAGQASVGERLSRAMQAYFDHVRENPVTLALLVRAESRPEPNQPPYDFVSARRSYERLARAMLDEAAERGEIRSDVDLDDAVLALVGMVDQGCRRWLHEGRPIPHDFAERAVDLLFRGLAS